jgi:hypothetical protein
MHWFSWEHWTRNPPCFRKKLWFLVIFARKPIHWTPQVAWNWMVQF